MDLRSFAGAIARYEVRRGANWVIPGSPYYDWTSMEFHEEHDNSAADTVPEVVRMFIFDLCYAETGNGRSMQHGWRTNTNPNRLADRLYTWRSCDY